MRQYFSYHFSWKLSSSWERHVGMLDWYSNGFNLIVYDTDVHPQDRSKMILQVEFLKEKKKNTSKYRLFLDSPSAIRASDWGNAQAANRTSKSEWDRVWAASAGIY